MKKAVMYMYEYIMQKILKGLEGKKRFTKKQEVGKTIDSLKNNSSTELNLSKRYTNHSLRVTLITVLKNGFSDAEIANCMNKSVKRQRKGKGRREKKKRQIITKSLREITLFCRGILL